MNYFDRCACAVATAIANEQGEKPDQRHLGIAKTAIKALVSVPKEIAGLQLVKESPTDLLGSPAQQKQAAKAMGFTGDECIICKGMNMVRNGSCLLCSDCGSTTGCS